MRLSGTSLVIQWLGLCASTARNLVWSLVGKLTSHKSPHAAKKKKKKKKKNPKQKKQKKWDGQGNLTGKAIFEQKQEGKKEKHKEILLSDHMS